MDNFSESNKVMYQPFSSILNPGFWQQLTDLKLNQLKLKEDPIDVYGSYSCNLSDNLPCLASFDHNSLKNSLGLANRFSSPLHGQLICTNIIQEFLDYNKKDFINAYGAAIWQSIISGNALEDPEKHLSKFCVLIHADLKKYKFYYWFAFPAINYPKSVYNVSGDCDSQQIDSTDSSSKRHKSILDFMSEEVLQQFQKQYDELSDRSFSRAYFIVKNYRSLSDGKEHVKLLPLTKYKEASQPAEGEIDCSLFFAYSEPCANQVYPGWPLRNFLCLIAVQFKLDHVRVIRVRRGQQSPQSKVDIHHSMVVEITYQLEPIPAETPMITGWEKNESQQLGPKRINLSSLLDPKKLAEDAVDLNLKLMKWRLVPNLDLEKIASAKCLLLGSGTLGCHIARGLLAWGVKNLSIVDNGRISYSNPVRQTLYSYEDCIKSGGTGLFKAEAAVSSLKKIHPSVNATAYVMSIPMPGHSITEKEIKQTKEDIHKLEKLIEDHDVIFLLMDTRESRWLPSVIALSKQKLVINAAIGFDTFLLQRYGIRDFSGEFQESTSSARTPCSSKGAPERANLSSNQLGCYFCNDIVAPGDSTLDRTLDQQCTVSRPGVSMMVSALAVELFASIMSSAKGPLTPAPLEVRNGDSSMMFDEDLDSELGMVPHTIRGNLTRYHIYMPSCASFNKCSACSPAVLNAYRSLNYEFLLKVFNDPSHLEEIAGLKDLQNVDDCVWDLDSDIEE